MQQCRTRACALVRLSIPNMSQHVAIGWPNACNMLRPTMLRLVVIVRPELANAGATILQYVVLICCYRSAGAYCAFQLYADSKIQSSTDKCVFPYRQSNVRRLLPASDNCRASGSQIVEHNSDNGTVLGSSRKQGGAAEHLIDGSEKRLCWLSF